MLIQYIEGDRLQGRLVARVEAASEEVQGTVYIVRCYRADEYSYKVIYILFTCLSPYLSTRM